MKIEELSDENPCTIIDVISGSPKCGSGGGSDTRGSSHSNLQRELCDSLSTGRSSASSAIRSPLAAQVKKLTFFIQYLAIISKTVYVLDKLAVFWANVVLLSSYASVLKPIDFWFATIILIVKGPRILSLSSKLAETHLATPSHPLPNDMMLPNENHTWLTENVRFLPRWVLVPKNINYLFHWLQIFGAVTCVALSSMRLKQRNFGEEPQNNQKSVLIVFYILALVESLMFLLEKGYWTWKIQLKELFTPVINELKFGSIGIVFLRGLFFDSYSKCMNGNISDELTMDPISYAEKLLNSNSLNDKIIGAKILEKFVKDKRFSVETLRKIGSSPLIIKPVIEMLIWRHTEEKDLWHSASQIFAKVTSQHAQLVVAIPGAIETVASLLRTGEMITDGLHILKHISRNHVGCEMIQNKQDLLARIIYLTSSDAALLCNEQPPESHIKVVRRALKVVINLLSATGDTGEALQRDISESKYLMSTVEISLKYGLDHLDMDILSLGTKILSFLEGYNISVLVYIESLFLPIEESRRLTQGARHSSKCVRILLGTKDVVKKLVVALGNPVLRVIATKILRILLAHSYLWSFDELHIVVEKMPMVLKTIMEESENKKLLEASIGVAVEILEYKKVKDFPKIIERAGIKDEDFVGRLVEIFWIYDNPNETYILLARLVNSLMICDPKYIYLFRKFKMEQQSMFSHRQFWWTSMFSHPQSLTAH